MIGRRLQTLAGAMNVLVPTLTVVAAGTVDIQDKDGAFYLSAASGLSVATGAVLVGSIIPGRIVTFIGTSDTNTVTFTRTAIASAAEGTVALGGATRALGNGDVLTLMQLNDGSWTELNFVNVA